MTAAAHILIVEDERVVARDLQRTLADLGYDVPLTVASGDAAITAAGERRPDLVLMDIQIKGSIDGVETAEVLRSRFGVPVIYLTAFADSPTVARAKVTEPFGYLSKPVKLTELRTTVEIALYKQEIERRLRERERWFATTLRSIGDAVVSFDAAGHVTYLNPVAEAILGIRSDAALGRDTRDVIRLFERGSASPLNPVDAALRERRIIHVSGDLETAGGTRCAISDSVAPLIGESGALEGAVMVFSDVTEQLKTQRQLETVERLASLGVMAAGVRHEVNTPLAFVLANVRFVSEELRARRTPALAWIDDLESALTDAADGAGRVAAIVDKLGVLAQGTLLGEPVDLIPIVNDVIESLTERWRSDSRRADRALAVVVDLDETPHVVAEAARLRQVLVDIVGNALDAMPVEGRESVLRVVARTGDAGQAIVEVSDNGVGMSAAVLAHACEPFFTTKGAVNSSGLGLSVARGVVKSLGGELALDSTEGHGTRVSISLPAAKPTESRAAFDSARDSGGSGARRASVLVIADDAATRSVTRRALEASHSLTCPSSVAAALALVGGGAVFDVVLCSTTLAELAAADVYDALARSSPSVAEQIIFLNADGLAAAGAEMLRRLPNRRILLSDSAERILAVVGEAMAARLSTPHGSSERA